MANITASARGSFNVTLSRAAPRANAPSRAHSPLLHDRGDLERVVFPPLLQHPLEDFEEADRGDNQLLGSLIAGVKNSA